MPKSLRVSGFFRGSNNITNERIITMEDNKKNQEAMPAKNVRLRVDQWEDCDRLTKKLSLPSEKHFIRDAVDFYIEFLNAKSSSKFLTPALESVIDAKNRDSEGRINRNLYRLAVEQNHLARIIAYTYDIPDEVVKELRAQAIRDVQETNGTIRVDEIPDTKPRKVVGAVGCWNMWQLARALSFCEVDWLIISAREKAPADSFPTKG